MSDTTEGLNWLTDKDRFLIYKDRGRVYSFLIKGTQPKECKITNTKLSTGLWRGAPEKEGFPGGSVSKESTPSAGDPGSRPWVRKIPYSRKWQSIPVSLPGKFHGQRSPAVYRAEIGHNLGTKSPPPEKEGPLSYSSLVSQQLGWLWLRVCKSR